MRKLTEEEQETRRLTACMTFRADEKIRELIAAHPSLSVVYFVQADCDGEYGLATHSTAEVGIVLLCKGPNDERIYTDEDELRDDIYSDVCMDPKYNGITDDEYDKLVDAELEKYEPYWEECIIVYLWG